MVLLAYLVGFFALALSTNAFGQTPKSIAKSETRVQIDVPEFSGFRESYWYSQSSDYAWEHYVAALWPNSGTFPHVQVVLDQLAPAYYFGRQAPIDEDQLRRRWTFLKNKQLAELIPSPGGRSEKLRTVRFRVDGAPCFAFEAYVGSPDVRHGYSDIESRQRVSGYFCNSPGTTISDGDMAHILSTVKIANPNGMASLPGASRSRLSSAPSASVEAAPSRSVATSSASVSQSGGVIFKAPPIGLRMHTMNQGRESGYFQVMAVDGTSIHLVNAGNRTSILRGGLIWMRDNSSYDAGLIQSLWPLVLGKEISFEETIGQDKWIYTVKILRAEEIAVPAGRFQTFVIEIRDRSVSPLQGNFDRTRTIWYAPSEGMPIQLRSTQTSGPPANLFNWEASTLVRP